MTRTPPQPTDQQTATAQEPVRPPARLTRGLRRRYAYLRSRGEAGMSTAEYAVGTVAACAFAAVLYRVVTGGSIVTGLTDLVDSALATLS
jgi:hypothetical protein